MRISFEKNRRLSNLSILHIFSKRLFEQKIARAESRIQFCLFTLFYKIKIKITLVMVRHFLHENGVPQFPLLYN
jgi:hypothetical protein